MRHSACALAFVFLASSHLPVSVRGQRIPAVAGTATGGARAKRRGMPPQITRARARARARARRARREQRAQRAINEFLEPSVEKTPWPRRHRVGIVVEDSDELTAFLTPANPIPNAELRRLGLRPPGRVSKEWPPEPEAPDVIDDRRFASAVQRLCPDESRLEPQVLAAAILRNARRFHIDPFLLGALVYHQSRCRPRWRDGYGVGLARINLGLVQRGLRRGSYSYAKPDGQGGFRRAELRLRPLMFTPDSLLDPQANMHLAAALLRSFAHQCPEIDEAFGSIQHRHWISHFIWGDRVRGTMPEDQIMTARRRLLDYYVPYSAPALGSYRGQALSSPLDGAPRLVIGVMGDPREGGRRAHAGIDLAATEGEPVRTIAPGVVKFAGVELRRKGLVSVPPERIASIAPGRMGVRGVMVTVQHDNGLVSLYSHLLDYEVREGQRLRQAEHIGRVGRTGVHTSDAHLHLGMFELDVAIDPLHVLTPYVVERNEERIESLAELN